MSWSARQVLDHFAVLQPDADFWAPYTDRLHRDEARALAHGEIGIIKRPFDPDWPVGVWMEVASNLWIKPHRPRRTAKGWRIRFDVRDWRAHLVRRVPAMFEPPQMDDMGTPIPPDLDSIEWARQDGNYTAAAELAITDGGDAVDDLTQKRFTREALDRERLATGEVISAAEDVLKAIKERCEVQPTLRREYWPVRRELDRFIQRERNKAA